MRAAATGLFFFTALVLRDSTSKNINHNATSLNKRYSPYNVSTENNQNVEFDHKMKISKSSDVMNTKLNKTLNLIPSYRAQNDHGISCSRDWDVALNDETSCFYIQERNEFMERICILSNYGGEFPQKNTFIFVFAGFVLMIVSVLGLAGNIMSIVTLANPILKKQKFTLYLIPLCIFDTVVLSTQLLKAFNTIVNYYDTGSVTSVLFKLNNGLQMTRWVTLPLENIGVCGSIFVTVLLSLDRCVAVVTPNKWSTFITSSRIKIALVVILIMAITSSIPLFVIQTYRDVYDSQRNITVQKVVTSSLLCHDFFRNVYSKVFLILFHVALPVTTLFAANTVMVISLKRRGQTKTRLQYVKTRMTYQVLCISMVTLVFRILLSLIYVQSLGSFRVYNYIYISAEIMGSANSGVNFVFYCYFGTQFQKVFNSFFRQNREVKVTREPMFEMIPSQIR